MKKQITAILTIILVVIGAIFVVLNTGNAEINFGFGKVDCPLIILIVIVFFFGAFFMFLLSSLASFKKGSMQRKENKMKQAHIKDLTDQIDMLKGNKPKDKK